jgi:hypothetical protein
MVRQTSIDAYNRIRNSSFLSERKKRIVEIFLKNRQGLTASEVVELYASKYPLNRRSEGIRNRVTKFYLTKNEPIRMPKKLSKEEKKVELLSMLVCLRLNISDPSLVIDTVSYCEDLSRVISYVNKNFQ